MTEEGAAKAEPKGDGSAGRAVVWIVLGFGGAQVLRLLSSLVLTRLLVPEVYGLMELVFAFIVALHLFSDFGLETAILQSRRGEETGFLNTAWTVGVARGLTLYVLCALGSGPVAAFYEEPELRTLLLVAGLTSIIDGFCATSMKTEVRRLNQKAVISLELASQVVTVAVQIGVAYVEPSAWAIVFGGIAGAMVRLVGSHLYLDAIRHRFFIDRTALDEIVNLGRWIFLSTACTFVGTQADRILIGKLVDLTSLGLYAIATRLSSAVMALQTKLIHNIVFPVLNREKNKFEEGDEREVPVLLAAFDAARFKLDVTFCFGCGLLLVGAPIVVDVLYDDRYLMAGHILSILSISLAASTSLNASETLLFSLGHTRYGFYRSLARAVYVVVAVPIAHHLAGFWGIVWAMGLNEVPVAVVIWIAKKRIGLLRMRVELRSFVFFFLGIGVGVLASLVLVGEAYYLPDLTNLPSLPIPESSR
ncbi:MAG: oligosaccharide flippase family protein [Myxococcota bacterium]